MTRQDVLLTLAKLVEDVSGISTKITLPLYVVDKRPAAYVVEHSRTSNTDAQSDVVIHDAKIALEFFLPVDGKRKVELDNVVVLEAVTKAWDIIEKLESTLFGKKIVPMSDPIFAIETDYHLLDGNILHVGLVFDLRYYESRNEGCS